MIPVYFPEANKVFGPPKDLTEEQCSKVHAFVGEVQGGGCDGMGMIVVAYEPSPYDLEVLNNGGKVYLSCLGSLPPHFLTTSFERAIAPA